VDPPENGAFDKTSTFRCFLVSHSANSDLCSVCGRKAASVPPGLGGWESPAAHIGYDENLQWVEKTLAEKKPIGRAFGEEIRVEV
jgi:hypothetical protein